MAGHRELVPGSATGLRRYLVPQEGRDNRQPERYRVAALQLVPLDWISGDQVVEQHIHNIDVLNWCFNGPPKKFLAQGGRANRDNDILPLVKDTRISRAWA